MVPTEITHAADDRVDIFRRVKGRNDRNDPTFVAESELVLDRLVASDVVIRAVLVTPARANRVVPIVSAAAERAQRKVHIFVAAQTIVDEIVGYPLHRGVIALAERPAGRDPKSIVAGARTIVVLEDVADPENVGSIFRHAAGFGVDAVLLHGHTGDPLYRKTVRTSMGWTLTIPYAHTSSSEIAIVELLHTFGFASIALTPSSSAAPLHAVIDGLTESTPVAFLLGAEGPGLTEPTMAAATYRARITLAPGVDSLNVASAGAIALYALTARQPIRLQTR